MPEYPATGAGREGSVMLRFTIGADGGVHDAVVAKSDPPGVFDAVALAAVATWRYTPEMVDGVAVAKPEAALILQFKPPKTSPTVKLISGNTPLYPRDALQRGLEGTVRLRLDVNAVGRPENIMVLDQVAGGALDRAAIQSVEEWQFALPQVDGQPHAIDNVIVAVPFKLADAEVEPVAIFSPKPSYPEAARYAGYNGYCVVTYRVADDGAVSDATILYSIPQGVFDSASLAAIRQWRFQPPASETAVRVRRVRRLAFDYFLDTKAKSPLNPGEWVTFSYTVLADGSARDVRVKSQSRDYLRSDLVVDQVRRAHFQPVIENGVPVDKPNQTVTIYGRTEN